SDITYRIYDYGRLGLDGKPRQLHTEQAKDAIDYTVYPDYRTAYAPALNQEVRLVSCPYFTTSLWDLTRPVRKDLSSLDSFVVVMCLAGEATLATEESQVTVRQGETVLVPATARFLSLTPASSSAKLLTACIE
ncbi:MAG: mannose-6-phosphate isomerase, partial [Bacteroidales bacterium]|nr:mannose-6-phosphate isomerase [Bacteroidales bacterium]